MTKRRSQTTWKKARKKPVIVEFREVQPKTLIRVKHFEDGRTEEVWGEIIETLEGDHEAHIGKDFIIKGVHGETYPIKKEIFYKTYNIIADESSLEGCFSCGR